MNGLEGSRPRRPSAAHNQAKTGASLPVIGKSLNHKNQSTTAIYARLDLDPVRSAMEKATAAMLEAANAPAKVVKLRRTAGGDE